MPDQVSELLKSYVQERNALIAEANERAQTFQQSANEHNARMTELQTRVTRIEGAMQALQRVVAGNEKYQNAVVKAAKG